MAIENIDVLKEAEEINVQKEAEELGEILDEFETIKEMPAPVERFYPINRKARRMAAKRSNRG